MQSKPTSPKISDRLLVDDALRVDRHRLLKIRAKISSESFSKQLSESIEKKRLRSELNPSIHYDQELPITAHRLDLIEKIRSNQVLIVCGETGSGKSTQLPKFCLEAGLGRDGMIGHTQPRRLAARSIANRISQEIGDDVGNMVGYKVRFGDQTNSNTLIKLMTDGILLAETQTDKFLNQYDALIIDEAHERSLNIDFLLGYLKKIRSHRIDLKIIITSATIDAKRFADHFATDGIPAPIISVEGRGYPVEIFYLPWEDKENTNSKYDLSNHVIQGLSALSSHGSGDTLVFLPTERDIREVSHRVAGHYERLGLANRFDLLPLYARLPQSQQQKIFNPIGNKLRIIFATNVAESSLTVPKIRYVIDSGTARISRYNPRLKVQRLPIEPISQASANQRSGRCGRLGPGICIRLFSQNDFDGRAPYTTPEIQRANLASVILQLKSLKLGRIEDFPLLDPPKPTAINDGLRTLREINAIDEEQMLTQIGSRISKLPVDPRVARILIAAKENRCLSEVLPIAAALEIQDPRERPIDKQQAADECHEPFKDTQSDFISLLKLWKYYGDIRTTKSRSQVTKTLRRQYLSSTRMREWADVYRQLKNLISIEDKVNRADSSPQSINSIRYLNDSESIVDDELYAKIHQSLLSGLLSGVALAENKKEYIGAGGLKLKLWPGSGLSDTCPKWIVASEVIETTSTFARVVARVHPDWIELCASHLLNRSHSDPYWSTKKGAAFCFESQHLFGLPVVLKRRVPLSPIDPTTARDLLIDPGLSEGLLRTNARFVRHNQSLLNAIADLASRTRNRDFIVDNYQIANLYRERLPTDVTDRGSLEKLDRKVSDRPPNWMNFKWSNNDLIDSISSHTPHDDVSSLFFHPSNLIGTDLNLTDGDFPDEIEIGGSKLPLEYSFSPGNSKDGIRLKVHQSTLSQISEDTLEWMVPGFFIDKLIQLIKSLPKRLRRNFVPAADAAKIIAESLIEDFGRKPFYSTVCKALSQYGECEITESDFQGDKLEEYLNFLITVVDDAGETIAENRCLAALQKSLPALDHVVKPVTNSIDMSWSRVQISVFDIEELPKFVLTNQGGLDVRLFPGLVDHGQSVSTELFSSQEVADLSILRGTCRLFYLAEQKEIRSQVRHLPGFDVAKIKLSNVLSSKNLENRFMDLLTRVAFVENNPPIRSIHRFREQQKNSLQRISIASQEISRWLRQWIDSHFQVRSILEQKAKMLENSVFQESIHQQLSWLYHDQFLEITPWRWLIHYPRYLDALFIKIERLSIQKDRINESETIISDLWNRWLADIHEANRNAACQSNSEFRWMIEELRVSLFAQSLGTSVKVSPQRCEKLLHTERVTI